MQRTYGSMADLHAEVQSASFWSQESNAHVQAKREQMRCALGRPYKAQISQPYDALSACGEMHKCRLASRCGAALRFMITPNLTVSQYLNKVNKASAL